MKSTSHTHHNPSYDGAFFALSFLRQARSEAWLASERGDASQLATALQCVTYWHDQFHERRERARR